RLALEELHGQERGRTVAAEVEDAAHVRVADLARELDLALEALEGAGPLGQIGPDRLQRHADAELEVLGGVDLAHAALGEEAEHAVAAGDQIVGVELPRAPGRPPLERGGPRLLHPRSSILRSMVDDTTAIPASAGPARRRPEARLLLVHPPELARAIELRADETIIGRAPEGLAHPTLSRRHLAVRWDGAIWRHVAADLGSKNGSAVDGTA